MAIVLFECADDPLALGERHVAGVQQRAKSRQVRSDGPRAERVAGVLGEHQRTLTLSRQGGQPLAQVSQLGRLTGDRIQIAQLLESSDQLQHIFDDPVFPLFVAYRRLHTAVRIKADLLIHHWQRPREEAVALYQRHLQFDLASATGQVRYQELHPGYMTCYYYGCRQLERWYRELPLDERTFTETTFSLGWVNLRTAHSVLTQLPASH